MYELCDWPARVTYLRGLVEFLGVLLLNLRQPAGGLHGERRDGLEERGRDTLQLTPVFGTSSACRSHRALRQFQRRLLQPGKRNASPLICLQLFIT